MPTLININISLSYRFCNFDIIQVVEHATGNVCRVLSNKTRSQTEPATRGGEKDQNNLQFASIYLY